MTHGKMTRGHFSIINKFLNLKKGFSNLEPEGGGRGIIMGVTRLLLLEPFYTIQTQKAQTFLGGVYAHSFLKIFERRATFVPETAFIPDSRINRSWIYHKISGWNSQFQITGILVGFIYIFSSSLSCSS